MRTWQNSRCAENSRAAAKAVSNTAGSALPPLVGTRMVLIIGVAHRVREDPHLQVGSVTPGRAAALISVKRALRGRPCGSASAALPAQLRPVVQPLANLALEAAL